MTTGNDYPTATTLQEFGTLPTGVTFTDNGNGTASFAGTPEAGTGGVYAFTITAQNDFGSGVPQTFTLTVDEAPSITSLPATGFTIGTAGTFTVTTGYDYPTATTLQETGTLPAGVTFTDNGDGTATLTGTPNAGTNGTYPITITADNGVGDDAVENFTLTVLKKTVTTLNVPTFAEVFGEPITLTATVVPAVGSATLSGTVTFFDGSTPIGAPVTLSGGKATLTTAALGAGSNAITAVYSGGGAYGVSTSPTVAKSVAVASTHVQLTPSTLAPVYGQPITFTAHVNAVSPSTVTPTGTITFMDGSSVLTTATVTNGVATLTDASLAVGKHALTAVFASANANDGANTSVVLNETVGQAYTVVTVTAAPGPAVVGQSVTLTAHVNIAAPGSAAPTGLVTFRDGLTLLGTANVSDGIATFTTASLAAGTHTFMVYYGGDGDTTTTMAVARLQVNAAATTVDLSSSPTTSLAGQSITLTAQVGVVAPGVAVPSGTVAFYRGSTLVGTGTVSSGVASVTTQKLTAGTYHFTAVYRGDSHCQASSSTWTVTVNTVGHGTTTVTLNSSADPSTVGSPVTFTATVAAVSPAGTPTGTVTFYNGTSLLGSAGLSAGTATLPGVNLASGTYSITANYSGDVNYAANTSAVWTQTVQVGTTTTLTFSAVAPVYGQPVTITARVSPTSYSPVTPTGTITFMEGSTVLGTATLTNGVASLPNQSLAVGTNGLTAVFASTSAVDAGNTSAVFDEKVGQARTAITFTALSPTVYGQSVTLTANVSVATPGAATPTGSVTFNDGLTSLGSGVISNGVATFTTSSLAAGTHRFTIAYPGDADTTGSNTSGELVVDQAATTVDLSSSPQFGVAGQSITLTAQVAVVAPGVAVPSGTVAFYNGSTLLGTGIVSNSVASFTTQKLAAGTYAFTVVYRGDSHCQSSASNWTIMMVNPPVISSVTLTPATPLPDGPVTATVAATDPQSLPLLYTYVWSVNGTTVQTDTGIASATDQINLRQLTGVGVVSGATVKVSVTASNVLLNSATSSASVTALGPVVTGVAIGMNDPTNQNVTNVTATPSVTDSPSQTIIYTYQWFLGAAPIPGATGSTLDLTQVSGLQAGSTIAVTVVPTDSGSITGLAFTSTAVTIAAVSPTISLNTPTASSVAITPDNVANATMLMATPQSPADPLGQPIAYSYQWLENGSPISTATTPSAGTATLILSQLTSVNSIDTFAVLVTPSDGTLTGPTFTSGNVGVAAGAGGFEFVNPPVITTVTLASANNADASGTVSITGGDIVTATVSGSDPQGLNVTYTYAWEVNGVVVQTDSNLSTTSDQLNWSTVPGGVVAGQTVSVVVTPNNSVLDGVASTSNTLNVTA